jgi:hypothetical protein
VERFTRETWACSVKYSNQSWAREACGLAKAARVLLIPMAVSSALVLVSLYILLRDRGGLRWLFGGKGRYGGFENMYEMRPTAAGASSAQPHQPVVPQPIQH